MGVCIFCGVEGPLSKEHVIPQWMHSLLPKYKQSYSRDVRAIAGSKGLQQVATKHVRIGRPITASQPPIACRTCSSGWMSGLQKGVQAPMKSMILGREVLPSEDFWHQLIAWRATTTMTGEYIDRRFITIPQKDRTALYRHCKGGAALDLPGWEFGMTNYFGTQLYNPTYRHYRQRLNYDQVSKATTFRFGELVLTAYSGVDQLLGLKEVLEVSDYRQIIQPLIASNKGPMWPPKVPLNDLTGETVTRRVLLALHRGFSEGRPEFIFAGEEARRWIAENVDPSSVEPAVKRPKDMGNLRRKR